jgi:hypothetical protein
MEEIYDLTKQMIVEREKEFNELKEQDSRMEE